MVRPKKDGVGALAKRKRKGYCDMGVWVDTPSGKKFHILGRQGDPDLQKKYVAFCQAYYTEQERPKEDELVLATLFRSYIEKRLPRLHATDQHHVRTVMQILAESFGMMKVGNFDSVEFRRAQALVAEYGEEQEKPWSFTYCNKLMGYLRSILKWGIGRKLFSAANILEIQAVEPIGEGDEVYSLGETEPRDEVPDWVVQKSIPFLSPMMADIVRLIRGACLRPSELVRMRCQDIMMSKDGVVEIGHHKTDRFHVKRFAAFTPGEMRILRKYTAGKSADEHVFSPRDAVMAVWSGYKKMKGADEKILKYSEEYTTHSLGMALKRQLDKARAAGERIPNWTLYQLRHAAVTENSMRYGVETASYIAGHTSVKTTAIYDHKALRLAVMAAKERAERE